MPNSRTDFSNYLKTKTGIEHLFFQPPESVKIAYPAIIYKYNNVDNLHANNNSYLQFTSYQVILIDKNPDSEIFYILLRLPMCKFERAYTSDNLNHFVFTIYY